MQCYVDKSRMKTDSFLVIHTKKCRVIKFYFAQRNSNLEFFIFIVNRQQFPIQQKTMFITNNIYTWVTHI